MQDIYYLNVDEQEDIRQEQIVALQRIKIREKEAVKKFKGLMTKMNIINVQMAMILD